MEEEISDFKLQVAKQNDEIETLTINNEGLVKRIQILQEKEQ